MDYESYDSSQAAAGSTDYSGVINASSPNTAAPDASGGTGSFLSSLQNTLTSGINTLITEKISAKLALGAASDLKAVNAAGQATTKAAPSIALNSTTLLYVGGGILALVVLLAVLKKR